MSVYSTSNWWTYSCHLPKVPVASSCLAGGIGSENPVSVTTSYDHADCQRCLCQVTTADYSMVFHSQCLLLSITVLPIHTTLGMSRLYILIYPSFPPSGHTHKKRTKHRKTNKSKREYLPLRQSPPPPWVHTAWCLILATWYTACPTTVCST